MPRCLAIDYGEARIGLAACDEELHFAYPVETTPAQPPKAALERIAAVFAAKQCQVAVVGLPLREDGSEGRAAEKIRAFAAGLAKKLPPGAQLHFQDEYRSTTQAQELLRGAGKKEKNQRSIIDQAAAVVILNEYLAAHGLV